MTGESRFRVFNSRVASPLIGLAGVLLIAGCSDWKKTIGLEKSTPDEFAVELRAPLTMPPDFNLRPPQPGAPRPQEKSSDQQARQTIEQAGPGEPGKQAPDFRLRRAEDGLPDIGARAARRPTRMRSSASRASRISSWGISRAPERSPRRRSKNAKRAR